MNLVALASDWLVLLLIGLLLAAAVEDAIRLRISNLTCLAILAAGLGAMWLIGPGSQLWQNLVVFVGFLVVGTPLFAAKKMGGGDIKLLAVTGIWFDLQGAIILLASVLIAGGALAILLIGLRRFRRRVDGKEKPRISSSSGVIPYGVAISAGAIFSIALARSWI